MLRTILGVIAGMIVAWLLVMSAELLGTQAYPPPVGTNLADPQQLAAFIRNAPPTAMGIVVAGWSLAGFIGGWISAKISRHPKTAALIIGLLLAIGTILQAIAVPHPYWMIALGVLLPIPLALLGARLARKNV